MGYRAVDGKKFRQLRERLGLTQSELAEKMNVKLAEGTVSDRKIRDYETGKGANPKYLRAAADVFVVDYQDLIVKESLMYSKDFTTTYITLTDDIERFLLYQSFELYERLFPNPNVRPEPSEVERYIEQSHYGDDPWKDIYAVLHKADHVIGFCWASVHQDYPWAVMQSFGVLDGYRIKDKSHDFFNRFQNDIKERYAIKGFVIDIEPIDFELWKEMIAHPEDISFNENVISNLVAMRRLYLYQNHHTYVALGRDGMPLPYWLPDWDDNLLSFATPLILMVKPVKITRKEIALKEVLDCMYGMYIDVAEQWPIRPPRHMAFIEGLRYKTENEARKGWSINELPSWLFKNMHKLLLRGKKEAPDIWINL